MIEFNTLKMNAQLDLTSGKVDVTDPCYDRGTWCGLWELDVKAGQYNCYVDIADDGDWGERAIASYILRTEEVDRGYEDGTGWNYDFEFVNQVGVDSGLMSFSSYKPDFDDGAWLDVCNKIKEDYPVKAIISKDNSDENMFVTSTGYGDGVYDVLVSKNNDGEIIGIEVIFIYEDEDECEDDYDYEDDYEDEEDE